MGRILQISAAVILILVLLDQSSAQQKQKTSGRKTTHMVSPNATSKTRLPSASPADSAPKEFVGMVVPPNNGPNATIFDKPGYSYEYCKEFGVTNCHSVAWPRSGNIIRVLEKITVHHAPASDNDEDLIYYKVRYGPEGSKVGYMPSTYLYIERERGIPCGQMEYGAPDKSLRNIEAVINEAAIPKAPLEPLPIPEPEKPKPKRLPFPRLAQHSTLFNSRCENFMEPDGTVNTWGEMWLDAIKEINPDCIFNKMSVRAVCPKYKKFSQEKKEQFWIYVAATMGHKENDCNPRKKVSPEDGNNPNGWAVGLFQLEDAEDVRKGLHRNPKYCFPDDTREVKWQIYCAVSILDQTQCKTDPPKPLVWPAVYVNKMRHGKVVREVVQPGTYWGGLRSASGRISSELRHFPGCN